MLNYWWLPGVGQAMQGKGLLFVPQLPGSSSGGWRRPWGGRGFVPPLPFGPPPPLAFGREANGQRP